MLSSSTESVHSLAFGMVKRRAIFKYFEVQMKKRAKDVKFIIFRDLVDKINRIQVTG